MAGKVRVTKIKSEGKRGAVQQGTLRGLGLGKMNSSRELVDTPEVQGMIRRVRHLVRVENVG
jgi:large subunit ribosomal protein L30